MSKEQWVEAREQVIEEKINEFELNYGRYPTNKEVEFIENNVSEDDVVDSYSSMVDYAYEMMKD